MNSNSLLDENVVNDDYNMLPCSFHDLAEGNVSEVDPLGEQLDLNLDQESRVEEFGFNNRYNQNECEIVDSKNFFLMKNDIGSNTFHQLDSEDGLCYISSPTSNTTCITDFSPTKSDVSSKEISLCINNSDKNLHIANTDSNIIVGSINNTTLSENECYDMSESIDSKCFIDTSNVNIDDTLTIAKSEKLCYFSNTSDFTQSESVSNLDSQNSLTKTLRNIKRIPTQQCSPSNQSSDDVPYTSYNPCYEILSCTVLIDTSRKRELDFNGSVDAKIPDDSKNTKKTLRINALSSSNDKMYGCSECGKQFREKSHLVTHSRAHTGVRKFKCSKCELSFKTEVNLRFHLNSHNDEPLRCPHCDKEFLVRRVLSRHIRIVHSMENFECEQCGKTFKTRKNLIHHYGIHSGIRPYSCNICSKSFLHSSSLNTHLREHSLQRDCIECNTTVEGTSIGEEIDSKRQINDDTSIKSFNNRDVDVDEHTHVTSLCTCGSLCTGSCKVNKDIVNSSLCEHVYKPFLCSTCGKPFKLKSSLITHMKTHAPSTEYKCEECDKSFVKKVSWDVHMKQHRGERPDFMCDQCSQSYYTQFSLKRHYLKHTTYKDFQCQICNKRFWMKDALQVHLRSHNKERNFKCSFCGKCFLHKSSLVTHLRSIHPHSLSSQQAIHCLPGSSLITQR